jgi:curved DNA-binding protein CbpA
MLQMDRMTATAAKVEEQYRKLVPLAHPDSGGSDHAMAALNNARAEARRELGV